MNYLSLQYVDDLSKILILDPFVGFSSNKSIDRNFPLSMHSKKQFDEKLKEIFFKFRNNKIIFFKKLLELAKEYNLLFLFNISYEKHLLDHLDIYYDAIDDKSVITVKKCDSYSSDNNKGVKIIATKYIQRNTIIHCLCGTLSKLTFQEETNLIENKKSFSIMYSQRRSSVSLFLGTAALLNYHCNANCKFINLETKIKIMTTKNIFPEEELFCYYGEEYFGLMNEKCECSKCNVIKKNSQDVSEEIIESNVIKTFINTPNVVDKLIEKNEEKLKVTIEQRQHDDLTLNLLKEKENNKTSMDVPISNEVPDFYKKCESLKVNSYSSIAISENINNKLCKILSDVSNTDQDIHNHQKYDVLSKNLHKYEKVDSSNILIFEKKKSKTKLHSNENKNDINNTCVNESLLLQKFFSSLPENSIDQNEMIPNLKISYKHLKNLSLFSKLVYDLGIIDNECFKYKIQKGITGSSKNSIEYNSELYTKFIKYIRDRKYVNTKSKKIVTLSKDQMKKLINNVYKSYHSKFHPIIKKFIDDNSEFILEDIKKFTDKTILLAPKAKILDDNLFKLTVLGINHFPIEFFKCLYKDEKINSKSKRILCRLLYNVEKPNHQQITSLDNYLNQYNICLQNQYEKVFQNAIIQIKNELKKKNEIDS